MPTSERARPRLYNAGTMPYEQTPKKIRGLVGRVFEDPEIKKDLEERGIREDIVTSHLVDHASEIWQIAAEQIDAFNSVERSAELAEKEFLRQLPVRSRYLRWAPMLGLCVSIAALLVAIGVAVYWFRNGWGALASVFSRSLKLLVSTPVLWWPLVPILGFLIGWYVWELVHFRRAYEEVSARAERELQIETAGERLRASSEIADVAVVQAMLSLTRGFLESQKLSRFGVKLPEGKADGLAEVLNSDFEMATRARARVARLIETTRGASIGVSGPRGVGKTTLLWSLFQTGNVEGDVLSVFTSAPVQYDPRDFVLHLFSSVCLRIIEKQVGREPASLAWRVVTAPPRRPPAIALYFRRLWPNFAVLGAILCIVGLYFAAVLAHTVGTQGGASVPASWLARYVQALGVSPASLVLWGLLIFTGTMAANAFVRYSLRVKEFRYEKETDPFDLERDPVAEEASHILSAIRFQQSYSSGWSGSFTFPAGFGASRSSGELWSERQQTVPDIVMAYRAFLRRITGGSRAPYRRVVICIDELDKLESDEAAEQFLNGIKSVFNQANCFYIVSVSETAMSRFERRGVLFRDAFDSSFDEIIGVDYLDLNSSKRLLRRRVLNVSDPFLCFCHCVSGGLPRDLVRACRNVFELRDVRRLWSLQAITEGLVLADVEAKMRAAGVAARRLSLGPELDEFLGITSGRGPGTEAEVWSKAGRLSAFLERLARMRGSVGDVEKVFSLAVEMLVLVYFDITLLQVFQGMDEARWRLGEGRGLFERLAEVRREATQNPSVAAAKLTEVRNAFNLSPGQDRVSP